MPPRQVPLPSRPQEAPLAFLHWSFSQRLQGPGQLLSLQAGAAHMPERQMRPSPQSPPWLAFSQRRPSSEQARQGPAQFSFEQVPTQAAPWHSARLPVQVWGVQVAWQAPARHWPPGQEVPPGASTQVSATQMRQGPGQLVAVHLGGVGAWQAPF